MVDISYLEIAEAIRKFSFPEIDLVVGIAEGGLVPAALAAYRTGVELRAIKINYRDENNTPRYEEPQLFSPVPSDLNGRTILLVDDVSVTGKTLDRAKALLPGCKIITFALKGKADLVLFKGIKDCVNWPWKPAAL
ncbi:MAG: phosphoribosyltransferase [Bacteroidota bacterium]